MKVYRLPRGIHQTPTARSGFSLRRVFYVASALTLLLAPTSFALTALSEGYKTSDDLSIGSLVSLKNNSNDEVVAAVTSNAENLLGVVINTDSSLLSVSNGSKDQVQVANTGTNRVLVSDINGKIKQGDHITASPLSGVGMKANGNVRVIGIAQGDIRGATKQTYKDKAGKEHSVTLGEVPVLINVAYFFKEPEKTVVPTAIQNIANSLAGRTVNTLPIVLSMAVFFIMLIIVSSIIYSMIRSSIISVGRNPMSQSAIYRDLIQLSGLVLIILGVGVGVIYFILTRL